MGWITIDASQVRNALSVIEQTTQVTPAILSGLLDASVRARIELLKANTPYQQRVDPRYPTHLRDSYHYRSTNKDTREIYISPISSAYKYMYVTEGTAPHTIFPDAKRALYWPGIQDSHPVAAAYNHPGTRANPFSERAEQQYGSSGIEDNILSAVTDGYTDMIVNSINSANMGGITSIGGMGSVGLGGIATSLLGLTALLGTLLAVGGAAAI